MMSLPACRLVLLSLMLAFLGGCMTSPLNGQDISAAFKSDPNGAAPEPIDFSGFTLNSSDQVTLQEFDTGAGQWKDLPSHTDWSVNPQAVADVDVPTLFRERLQSGQPAPVAGKDFNNWYLWRSPVRSYELSKFGQYDANKKRMFYEVRAVNAKATDSGLVSFDAETYQSCKDEHMPNGGGMAVIQNCKSQESPKVTLLGPLCGEQGQRACAAGPQWVCGAGLTPSLAAADRIPKTYPPGMEVTGNLSMGYLIPTCRPNCGSSGQACCMDFPPAFSDPATAKAVKCAGGLYCSEDLSCTSNPAEITLMDSHCHWNSYTANTTINGTTGTITGSLKADCPSGAPQEFYVTVTFPVSPNDTSGSETHLYDDQREIVR